MGFRMSPTMRIAVPACVSRKADMVRILAIMCTALHRELRHKAAVRHRNGVSLVDKAVHRTTVWQQGPVASAHVGRVLLLCVAPTA